MSSADERQGRVPQPLSGYVALIVCGVLLLGLMPLSFTRQDVARTLEPQSKPLPERAIATPPAPKPPAGPMEDAARQASRLFKQVRAVDTQPRHQATPVVNPLRDPASQPKRKGDRPGAAELLFDELP